MHAFFVLDVWKKKPGSQSCGYYYRGLLHVTIRIIPLPIWNKYKHRIVTYAIQFVCQDKNLVIYIVYNLTWTMPVTITSVPFCWLSIYSRCFLLLVITLVAIHNILVIYWTVFEPLDWLHYSVSPTPPRFLGNFACHMEKWPLWPIHYFFMMAPYLKNILWSWSTPVPSFMLLHINSQFLHNFHISAGL